MTWTLRIQNESGMNTKGDELTWEELDDNMIAAFREIKALKNAINFPAYAGGASYAPGKFVRHQSKLWKQISGADTFVAPGSDPLIWREASIAELVNYSNQDTKLAEGTADEVSAATLKTALSKIMTGSTIQITTARPISNPDVNSNWTADGSPYIGPWTALLSPTFGDLVSYSGTVYQNISGTNSAVDPVTDAGTNWDVYTSPFIGAWSSAGTYAQGDIVSFAGNIYSHLTTLQEVFKDLYFDGTAFYFRSNLGTWCKITSTKIEVPRVESTNLTVHGTSSLSLTSANGVLLSAVAALQLSANGALRIGNSSGEEIYINNNDSVAFTNNATFKKGILIGCYGGAVGIGFVNAIAIGGILPVVEHTGEFVIGNALNAQSGRVSFKVATGDDVPTEITINHLAAQYFTIPVGCSYWAMIKCIATQATNGDSAIFSAEGIIKNLAGTTSTSGFTFTQIESEGAMGTVSIAATADNANDRLAITVTGNSGTDIVWNVTVDYLKNKFQ